MSINILTMIQKLAEYNTWANRQITSYILNAGEIIADTEVTGSFPTVRKTLYHIWDAQVIWYSRLMGVSRITWPSRDYVGTLPEACTGLILNSEEFVSLARKVKDDLGKVITYKNLEGKEFSNTTEEIFMHCMNHGTYHRGQIITMLRQAGFTNVGSTDFIRFCREMK